MRKVITSIHEAARDVVRGLRGTPEYLQTLRDRKVEMLFAHLKRILRLDRLRLRDPAAPKASSFSPAPFRTSAKSQT
jgi:hypothetical protein